MRSLDRQKTIKNLMIKKVLCVDDDTIALTISQLLLKRTGFAEEVIEIDPNVTGSDVSERFESADIGGIDDWPCLGIASA